MSEIRQPVVSAPQLFDSDLWRDDMTERSRATAKIEYRDPFTNGSYTYSGGYPEFHDGGEYGDEAYCLQISDILRPSDDPAGYSTRRCFITGPGGSGKTRLAIRFRRDEASHYKLLLIMNAGDFDGVHPGMEAGFRDLAVALGFFDTLYARDVDIGVIIEAVHSWFHNPCLDYEGRKPLLVQWLLIVDNVRNWESPTLQRYLPRDSRNGGIIITTRNPDVPAARTKTDGFIRLNGLEMRYAIDMLLVKSGREGDQDARQLATSILSEWGTLPITLELLTAQLRKHNLVQLRDLSKAEKLDVVTAKFQSASGNNKDLVAQWAIMRLSNKQQGLLNRLAFFDTIISNELIKHVWNDMIDRDSFFNAPQINKRNAVSKTSEMQTDENSTETMGSRPDPTDLPLVLWSLRQEGLLSIEQSGVVLQMVVREAALAVALSNPEEARTLFKAVSATCSYHWPTAPLKGRLPGPSIETRMIESQELLRHLQHLCDAHDSVARYAQEPCTDQAWLRLLLEGAW
jgi:hypothetical protein